MSSVSNLTTTDGPRWNQPTNHGPVVSVMTWLLVVTTFLAVLARIATRLVVVHTIRFDDIAILLALVRNVWWGALVCGLLIESHPAVCYRAVHSNISPNCCWSWPANRPTLFLASKAISTGSPGLYPTESLYTDWARTHMPQTSYTF